MNDNEEDGWVPLITIGFYPDGEHGGVGVHAGWKRFRETDSVHEAIDAAIELLEAFRDVETDDRGTLH